MRWAIIPLLMTMAAAGCDRQDTAPEQGNAAAVASDAVPVENAAASLPSPDKRVDRSHAGEPAPTVAFETPAGAPTTLADFKGQPVLVNLWATWCAPCVAEMPTLDALAAREAGRLRVLTISQDTDGATKVPTFFREHGYTHLQANLDPKLALSTAYQASLPATILYDARGREVWRVLGGMDWTADSIRPLLAEAAGGATSGAAG